MGNSLKKWQHTLIRNNMEKYRTALSNYYIKGKRIVELGGGLKAFSLLSPPLGSAAAKRRIRLIMNNVINQNTQVGKDGSVTWGMRTPHFITIAVTYHCQCACQHCSAQSYKEDVEAKQSALTFTELKSAVKQTVDLGTTCVVFTGGEPLLYGRIYDLAKSVDKSKSICTLFTNGEYLNDETVGELKKAGVFGVYVSLDFSDQKEHDANRKREGIFQKAIDGIELCQDKGMLTGISSFITKEKIESGELDAMMELAKKLDVLEVFLFDIIPTGRLKEKRQCVLKENEFEMIKAFREKYNVQSEYPRIIHQTMFTSIAYPCAAEGCPAGVAQMHLRANGDVTPCDFTTLAFGNIRNQPLKEIWRAITSSDIYAKPSPRCRLSDQSFLDKIAELSSVQ